MAEAGRRAPRRRHATYGVRAADVPRVAERARAASSMQGNPIALTEDELASVMEAAL